MNRIIVAGLGPGALEYITPAAINAIKGCDLLIGGKRNLETLSFLNKEMYEFKSNMEAMTEYIESHRESYKICVAVSGDPGFYSMLDFLVRRFGTKGLEVIPGISSFQYLFCRLARAWKDYALASVHGRSTDIAALIRDKKRVFLLTDKANTPSEIAKTMLKEGFGGYSMIIGENLSYKDEKITELNIEDVIGMQFSDLCVVVIESNEVEL